MAQIADEYAGRLTVATVDVDVAPSLAKRYGVRGIPAFVLLKDGEIESQFSGYSRGLVLQHLQDAGIR